jgi:hypothetical protein
VSLELNGKSVVVYGPNGSGKSCFVDAIEYVLEDGRIEHLAHEYSGRRQEKAVINTHKPPGEKTAVVLAFEDGTEVLTSIADDGTHTFSGVNRPDWESRRTILRQHEVADFIRSTKGDKYSALLPLLGLGPMELAAENLRRISRLVEEQAELGTNRILLKDAETKGKSVFGSATDNQIIEVVEGLHAKYCPTEHPSGQSPEVVGETPEDPSGESPEATGGTPQDPLPLCRKSRTALDRRIAESSRDQRRHIALQDAAAISLGPHIDAVRERSTILSDCAEPLIAERLEILGSADELAKKLLDENEIVCPACGQPIVASLFREHVETEKARLEEIRDAFDSRKAAIGVLCSDVKSMQTCFSKPDLAFWKDEPPVGVVRRHMEYLARIDAEELRGACDDNSLKSLEGNLLPLIDAAAAASEDAPPDARELSDDSRKVDAAQDLLLARSKALDLERAEALVSYLACLEQGTREEIRRHASTVIGDISADIRTMWSTLHPGDAIEDVRLHLPEADKAIDVYLKFHGEDQESPRLTLSEGYRNGLGLCIFLAQAKRDAQSTRPLLLDDVVISFDRDHRGMIAGLLDVEFPSRQVVVLTHDREWFSELRKQLDPKVWLFKVLLPYETPEVGIRWSCKSTTFDEARARLKDRPDSAGNDVRKMMDVELALIAERLRTKLPFRRGDKNDVRMAHDFTTRLAADAKRCFEVRQDSGYRIHTDAVAAIEEAGRLLESWGNRASHTTSLVSSEAAKLLASCETALGCFRCSSCDRDVWYSEAVGQKLFQCGCGQLRWRYGKT